MTTTDLVQLLYHRLQTKEDTINRQTELDYRNSIPPSSRTVLNLEKRTNRVLSDSICDGQSIIIQRLNSMLMDSECQVSDFLKAGGTNDCRLWLPARVRANDQDSKPSFRTSSRRGTESANRTLNLEVAP